MSVKLGKMDTNSEIINRPTFLEYKKHKFVIMDAPTDANLHAYQDMLLAKSVSLLVRTCKPSYEKQGLQEAGINVVELPFKDGQPPPDTVIEAWLQLIDDTKTTHPIAVHCVAGLGRAPMLVAIAFIEAGMDATDAVEHIRTRRRGVFNQSQLNFLYGYTRRGNVASCCTLL